MVAPDVLKALVPVIKEFERLAIPYYIGGSVASSSYGWPRTTNDVDIIAAVEERHIRPLMSALQDAYYIDAEMIREAVQLASSFNLVHLDSVIKIDVFCAKTKSYDIETMQRRRPLPLDEETPDLQASFASPEDVILAKLQWYVKGGCISGKQWNDILGILKIQHGKLDGEYLIYWADKLQLSDLLQKAVRDSESGAAPHSSE